MRNQDGSISSKNDIKEIKYLLQETEIGLPLNNNVLRCALNLREELIACILTYSYQILVDKKMVIRAIKTDQMKFLFYMFSMNKNFEIIYDF